MPRIKVSETPEREELDKAAINEKSYQANCTHNRLTEFWEDASRRTDERC
jgi:hypothetical protein